MTMLARDSDAFDVRRVARTDGLLRDFNEAGVLLAADVHVALRLAEFGGELDESTTLAAAFAVRATISGSSSRSATTCTSVLNGRNWMPVRAYTAAAPPARRSASRSRPYVRESRYAYGRRTGRPLASSG